MVCQADITLFGGQPAGGKTDGLLGLAITQHKKSLIFRREAAQLEDLWERSEEILGNSATPNRNLRLWRHVPGGRTIKMAGCETDADKRKYQGRGHDLKAFDEICQFTQSQVEFICGWTRSPEEGQKTRIVFTGNPPENEDGLWVLKMFAPWLDKHYSGQTIKVVTRLETGEVVVEQREGVAAEDGELLWFIRVDGDDLLCDIREPFQFEGADRYPSSRAFIRSRLQDNPYNDNAAYRARLDAMPEPYRTQLLSGDWTIYTGSGAKTIVSRDLVRQAMSRWKPEPPGPCDSIGVDPAWGGADEAGLIHKHGSWFDKPRVYPGRLIPDGKAMAAKVEAELRNDCLVKVDVRSGGIDTRGRLKDNPLLFNPDVGIDRVVDVDVSRASKARDRSGKLGFPRLGDEMWWKFREALEDSCKPDCPNPIALPPDTDLADELCTRQYEIENGKICIEKKDEQIKRLGRSPARADSLLAAWYSKHKRTLRIGFVS